MIVAANALNDMVKTRGMERRVLLENVDVIASSRDPRLDPVVYADYYGGVARRFNKERQGQVLQALNGVQRDLIVLLHVDPEEAVRRIEQRIANEQVSSYDIMRPKWRHIHKNPNDLALLAQFQQMGSQISHRRNRSIDNRPIAN